MKTKCPECGQLELQTRRSEMAIIGIALILAMPTTMVVFTISLIGILFLPIIFLIMPFTTGLGLLFLIGAPFIKGTTCKKCGYDSEK